MSKKSKTELKQDSVESQHFHVGIELELQVPGSEGGHDDDACQEAAREAIEEESTLAILRNHLGLDRDDANNVESYFDRGSWIDAYMSDYDCGGDCGYTTGDEDSVREGMESSLKRLTGNQSFKVVSDGSVATGDGQIDAEVCWNYYASKETIKDNARILDYLKGEGCKFDTSCGLHINLNNYLNVPAVHIPAASLAFLFDFVAASRRRSSYCNINGMSGTEKYSMIFNQGDRLEFRFFSPTLEAAKLNHYITLANVVYRRLAGKDARLPKKTATYFLDKMVKVNGLTPERAALAIQQVNSILTAASYAVTETSNDESTSESEAA